MAWVRTIIILSIVFYGRTLWAQPSLNAFEDEGLAHEAQAVLDDGLTRFQDQQQLKRAIAQRLVLRVPDRAAGFYLDQRIGTFGNPEGCRKVKGKTKCTSDGRVYYRYARPYTVRFLLRLGKQYQARFHSSFMVSSMVRTCEYQKRIARGNDNAAPCDKTSHTAGPTVDLQYQTMTPQGRAWVAGVLLELEAKGLILASRERGQPVFHVMVRRKYQKWNP